MLSKCKDKVNSKTVLKFSWYCLNCIFKLKLLTHFYLLSSSYTNHPEVNNVLNHDESRKSFSFWKYFESILQSKCILMMKNDCSIWLAPANNWNITLQFSLVMDSRLLFSNSIISQLHYQWRWKLAKKFPSSKSIWCLVWMVEKLEKKSKFWVWYFIADKLTIL